MREPGITLDDRAVRSFRDDGFAVLAGAFAADALAAEVDDALRAGFRAASMLHGAGGIRFASVPMMSPSTPTSVSLADALAVAAATALGRAVLPGRAKGTSYRGESALHSDSDLEIPSLGFVAYLEPVRAARGALEVVPGSHVGTPDAPARLPIALETDPGDIVVFDEHLTHGSHGGGRRRQWRVDYIADPRTAEEAELVRRTFSRIFDPAWDGGYDVDRCPSFGDHWQRAHPAWSSRLGELGVIEMARAQEAATRERRDASLG